MCGEPMNAHGSIFALMMAGCASETERCFGWCTMAVIGNNQPLPDDSLTKVVEGKPGTSAVRLNQLRYFITTVDYGSFRKAAAALSVQESSISRRIRDLEDELGASLFMRHAGGVRLTV